MPVSVGGMWLWVKNGYPNRTPVSGKIGQNLRFPGGLILTHTHVLRGFKIRQDAGMLQGSNAQSQHFPATSLAGGGWARECGVGGGRGNAVLQGILVFSVKHCFRACETLGKELLLGTLLETLEHGAIHIFKILGNDPIFEGSKGLGGSQPSGSLRNQPFWGPWRSGLWNPGVSSHFCDTRESPLYMGW